MTYTTIAISPEHKKIVRLYAAQNDTSIKKVIEDLIANLISNDSTEYVIESKPLVIKE